MKQPEKDVFLSPGGRYMVEPARYAMHLSTGKEIPQVCASKHALVNFNIPYHRNHCVLIIRLLTVLIPPKHTLHPQVLVQQHVLDMDVFFQTVL